MLGSCVLVWSNVCSTFTKQDLAIEAQCYDATHSDNLEQQRHKQVHSCVPHDVIQTQHLEHVKLLCVNPFISLAFRRLFLHIARLPFHNAFTQL